MEPEKLAETIEALARAAGHVDGTGHPKTVEVLMGTIRQAVTLFNFPDAEEDK